MLNKLLIIFVIFKYCICFRFIPNLTTRFRNPTSSTQMRDVDDSSYLINSEIIFLTFSYPTKSKVSILSFINAWVEENMQIGDSINAKQTPTGVLFHFIPSPGSSLEVILTTTQISEKELSIELKKKVTIRKTNPQVESLIRFASQNLIDSLSNDIAELILEIMSKDSKYDIIEDEQVLPQQDDGVDLPFDIPSPQIVELNEEDVDLEYLESQAKIWTPQAHHNIVPTQQDLYTMMANNLIPDNSEDSSVIDQSDVPPEDIIILEENVGEISSRTSSYIEEEICVWETNSFDAKTAEEVLQMWAAKFTDRGTGISSQPVPGGLEISFVIADDIKVQYIVCSTSTGGSILTRIPKDTSDGGETYKLVLKASKNLTSNLQKYFASISMSADKRESSSGQEDNKVEATLLEDRLLESFAYTTQTNIPRSVQSQSQPSSFQSPSVSRKDPKLLIAAEKLGVNLETFEGRGLEEQAVKELERIMESTKKDGYLATIKSIQNERDSRHANTTTDSLYSEDETSSSSSNNVISLDELFRLGSNTSKKSWEAMLQRKFEADEDFSQPPATFPVDLQSAGLEKGIDIFEGPPLEIIENAPASSIEGVIRANMSVLFPVNQEAYTSDLQKMQLLLNELSNNADEMHASIIDSFKDLLLAENFLFIMKQLNSTQSDTTTRRHCNKIIESAKVLTAELGALAKTESIRHLETIHDVCAISARFQQDELIFLEELEAVKPRFDTALLDYLKFAMKEERLLIQSKGSDPDRFPTPWLQVLTVVHQGVFAEFEARFDRLLEPLMLTMRFDQPELRSYIFSRFVNITAPLELYYMRELALNMANSVMSMEEKRLPDLSLRSKMLQLHDDIELYLSEESINEKLAIFAEDARKQGKQIIIRHRNPVIQLESILDAEYGEQGAAESQIGSSVLDKYKSKSS